MEKGKGTKMKTLEQKIRKIVKQDKGHISYAEDVLTVELEEQEKLLQILKEEHKALGNYIERLRK